MTTTYCFAQAKILAEEKEENYVGWGIGAAYSDAASDRFGGMFSTACTRLFNAYWGIEGGASIAGSTKKDEIARAYTVKTSVTSNISVLYHIAPSYTEQRYLVVGMGISFRHLQMLSSFYQYSAITNTQELVLINNRYNSLGGNFLAEYLLFSNEDFDILLVSQVHLFLPPFSSSSVQSISQQSNLFQYGGSFSFGVLLRIGW
jgi:hypothetical protein